MRGSRPRPPPVAVTVILKFIKFNAWFAFACGLFALIVSPLIVDSALTSLGLRPERIQQDEAYLLAVSFERIVGILLVAYALIVRLLLKANFDVDNIRSFFALFGVGVLVWGGTFLFILSTRNPLLASIVGIGFLEWLLIPAVLLFTYKSTENWKAVKPGE